MALHFPEQRANEEVKFIVRPHWLTLLPQYLMFIVLALIPVGVLVALSASGSTPFTGSARGYTVSITSVYYLALVTWGFVAWLDYYLDVGIFTNERVVDIDQEGLFRRKISELNLDVLQDVSSSKHGILQTLVDFGDIEIQTASEHPNFLFQGIPHPDALSRQVSELCYGPGPAEQGTADTMKEAAEKMEAAAEKMEETGSASTPSQQPAAPEQSDQPPPTPNQPTPDSDRPPPTDEDPSSDLPREYKP